MGTDLAGAPQAAAAGKTCGWYFWGFLPHTVGVRDWEKMHAHNFFPLIYIPLMSFVKQLFSSANSNDMQNMKASQKLNKSKTR